LTSWRQINFEKNLDKVKIVNSAIEDGNVNLSLSPSPSDSTLKGDENITPRVATERLISNIVNLKKSTDEEGTLRS
jgi:hypothetical protein